MQNVLNYQFFFSDSNAARRQSLILRWTNSYKQKEKWIHITVLLMFIYKLLTNEPVEKKVPAYLKTVTNVLFNQAILFAYSKTNKFSFGVSH